MNIKAIRRIVADKEMYAFSLAMNGFIINGFLYSRQSGAVLMPYTTIGGKKIHLVKGFGMQIKRLKLRLEEIIREAESNGSE